jgi:asparagine synthetase B (glutamine-hydrolysing)
LVRERLKDRELPDRGLAFDRLISLPDELLLKADTATMAYSIEGRVPFLDRELFKLVGGAPNNWKRQGHTGKVPLRQILKTRLPKELVNRPKEGFSFSVSKFMQEYAPEKLKGALAWYQENYRGALPAIDASLKEALGKGKLREMLTVLGYSYYAIFILSDFAHRHRLTF